MRRIGKIEVQFLEPDGRWQPLPVKHQVKPYRLQRGGGQHQAEQWIGFNKLPLCRSKAPANSAAVRSRPLFHRPSR